MFKRLLCLWRYRRLLAFEPDPTVVCLQYFERYHQLCRIVSFNKADYRTRIRYSLSTKTPNLGRLLSLLDTAIQFVEARAIHLDTIEERRLDRRTKTLDAWLIDDDQIPYDENDAVKRLINKTQELVERLDEVKRTRPSMYAYYNQNMQFILLDVIEVLDALLAMQLLVDRRFIPHEAPLY